MQGSQQGKVVPLSWSHTCTFQEKWAVPHCLSCSEPVLCCVAVWALAGTRTTNCSAARSRSCSQPVPWCRSCSEPVFVLWCRAGLGRHEDLTCSAARAHSRACIPTG